MSHPTKSAHIHSSWIFRLKSTLLNQVIVPPNSCSNFSDTRPLTSALIDLGPRLHQVILADQVSHHDLVSLWATQVRKRLRDFSIFGEQPKLVDAVQRTDVLAEPGPSAARGTLATGVRATHDHLVRVCRHVARPSQPCQPRKWCAALPARSQVMCLVSSL